MNTYGDLYRFTSFGESHGQAIGVVLDGLPSGLKFSEEVLQDFLNRRRPGADYNSSRKELDAPQILSGLLDGKTLGTPLACVFFNKDARSEDYKNLSPRKGHADQAWMDKFSHVDLRGGGRSSGRETLSRVVAGAFAKMVFKELEPSLIVKAYASSIFNLKETRPSDEDLQTKRVLETGFVSEALNEQAKKLLVEAKKEGQSYGGEVEVRVFNPAPSLGRPVFKKLKSELAASMMSIGAVKSFELGVEVDLTSLKGTDFHSSEDSVYGGVSGGLSTGETIVFKIKVKPTSSILDVSKKGRHDPCIVPRLLVVAESMTYITLLNFYLHRRLERSLNL